MIAMLAVDGDSSVDSQLARIGLDGAGRRWSVAPVQSGFRGPGWTWLDLASLVDTQEVRGSDPPRPTSEAHLDLSRGLCRDSSYCQSTRPYRSLVALHRGASQGSLFPCASEAPVPR